MRLVMSMLAIVCLLSLGSPASAQTHSLVEEIREGACYKISTVTSLNGTLNVVRDGKTTAVKIVATNTHSFHDRVLATDRVAIGKAVRFYDSASSTAEIGGQPVTRALSAERRLIVARHGSEGLYCYSPAGSFKRPELELTSEHFETLHLAGVLPGSPTAVGGTWKIENQVVQSLCLFEGLISHELTGTLKEVRGRSALIAIVGSAKGVEFGAMVALQVAATVTFDLDAKRIIAVEWKQKDTRDQGPVTPAATVESTTILTRTVAKEPAELAKAVVPVDDDKPSAAKQLLHIDDKGRYRLLYDRGWHTVGQTDYHLVLRYLDRGDFVGQATLTVWKNASAGKHLTPEEFEEIVAKNWKMEQIIDRGEIPTDADRWVYRVSATGELDGAAVKQHFFAIASKTGEQMIVTFTLKPDDVARFGTRDLAIVNAIDFLKP